MRVVLAEGTRAISRNRVRQSGPRAVRTADRLDAAIKELADLDRLKVVREGRRVWLMLNPKLVKVGK